MLKISEDEKKALKGRGIIMTNDGEHFVARVVSSNGVFTAEQLRALTDAAEKYGDGRVALTVRLTIEIQGVSYENIEPLVAAVEAWRPRHPAARAASCARSSPARAHGLRPRPRGHAGVRRRALQRVLPRLARREAAAQVQDLPSAAVRNNCVKPARCMTSACTARACPSCTPMNVRPAAQVRLHRTSVLSRPAPRTARAGSSIDWDQVYKLRHAASPPAHFGAGSMRRRARPSPCT